MFHRPKTEDAPSETNKVEATKVEAATPADATEVKKSTSTPEAAQVKTLAQGASANNSIFTQKANEKSIAETKTVKQPTQSTMTKEPQMTKEQQPSSNPFLRPTQASVPAHPQAASYTPSYNAPSSQSNASSMHGTDSDRRLVLGQGITMSGEIQACDHLVIEGTVEASLKGARVLDVTETGTFYGSVEIEEATIAGRFEGEISVNGRLTIKGTGVVTGSIAYRELNVESGATIDGQITPLLAKTENRAPAEGDQGTKPEVKKVPPRNDNDGEQLPFEDTAAAAAAE